MTQRSIIEASPGWYVLRLKGSDSTGRYEVDREPIVGWETTLPRRGRRPTLGMADTNRVGL